MFSKIRHIFGNHNIYMVDAGLTNLAMDDHTGTLVLQPLHSWAGSDTWYHYGGWYPKLTSRISRCHACISSCSDQNHQ